MSTDNTSPPTRLLDLPIDIIYCILPYLDVPSFVALSSSCHAFHNPSFAQHASYWSTATRSTFRVPNQPVVANDGARWQKMYKRLLTQSKVYTWGNNEKACLGHSQITPEQLNAASPAHRGRLVRRSRHVSWPQEMLGTQDIGVVADMQCGGWSTNMLSSKGAVWSVGVLDGQQVRQRRMPLNQIMQRSMLVTQRVHATPTALKYPPGLPHPNDRYEPATAVKQFSAGRGHVLALSDSGRIWSWQNIDHAGYNVKFLDIELKEGAKQDEVGYVNKVVAGWNKSSALIHGAGIVVWDPLSREPDEEESEQDAALVLETATVPLTSYRQPRVNSLSHQTQDGEHVGEVQNFICLEDYILFNTHLGKVFASRITWSSQEQTLSHPIEIVIAGASTATSTDATSSSTAPSNDTRPSQSSSATDVQGSFRSFAIFTATGAVLTGNQDMLNDLFAHANSPTPIPLNRIPALQNTSVISLAFGDYHFHALHATGHITSYGTEPQACGALGLGGHADPEGRLRGLRYAAGMSQDARLVPHAYYTGRRVWFEKEKQAWITFLTSGGRDPEEARDRMRMCAETTVQGEVSEWVELEGRAWEEKFAESPFVGREEMIGELQIASFDDDGLGAYFALNVTAAGWHSGALVLVNEEMAARLQERCLVPTSQSTTIKPSPMTTETEAESSETQPEQTAGQSVSSALTDWTRWFMGLPPLTHIPRPSPPSPYIVSTPPDAAPVPGAFSHPSSNPGANPAAPRNGGPPISSRHDPNNPHAFLHPTNHGAADEQGRLYKWAEDVFPRLQLADGRDMPGTVEFSTWRGGERPVWDLGFEG